MALRFFLGANTKTGFFSLYPRLKSEPIRRVDCIKGGPGCGKSTCMAHLFEAVPGGKEEIFCSSDPDSLDGVIWADAALLDGTAPHLFDPALPGCDGDYLTPPPFVRSDMLAEKREALAALRAAISVEYARAYRLLAASALVREERRQQALPFCRTETLQKRAEGLLRREIPRKPGASAVRYRFLEGYTPKGKLCFWDTVTACAARVIALEDDFGAGEGLLRRLLEGAQAHGQEVYACLDPLEPEKLRHLLLPGCGLAFVTRESGETLPFSPARTIHLSATRQLPRALRGQLRLLAHTERALTEDAISCLAAAHRLHEKLEAHYRPHLDLPALEQWMRGLEVRFSSEAGEAR